jgi:hypothetical protein
VVKNGFCGNNCFVENKKQKLKVLKHVFGNSNAKSKTVDLVQLAQSLSGKKIITLQELQNLLDQMHQDKLIQFVANKSKKGYNYIIKLTNKGQLFLLAESNKASDFVVSVFVYVIFFVLFLLFVFVVKNFLEGYSA